MCATVRGGGMALTCVYVAPKTLHIKQPRLFLRLLSTLFLGAGVIFLKKNNDSNNQRTGVHPLFIK
jgi:hypothetical protein